MYPSKSLRFYATLCAACVFWFGLHCSLFPSAAHAETPSLPDPTRFALAVEQGDLKRVAAWLDDGLPADFQGDRIGSGLMIAAWEGNIAMMELFARHGARIDLTNRYDEQALLLAAWRGHLAAVQWLLDHGAATDRPGARWTALHYATFADHPQIVGLLLARGGDVNARAPNGSTVLMMAAREGHADLARQLLEAGADVQAVNERGESALSWAMRHGNFGIARLVSSQAEFARAAQADPASFGAPQRSEAGPAEIEEILRQIRLAEAAGQSAASLRAALQASVERFRQESRRIVIDTPKQKTARRGKPGKLLITARRAAKFGETGGAGTPAGERAEMIYRDAASGTPVAMPGDDSAAAATAAVRSEIGSILERMQQARTDGQPVDALRKSLYEAVARLKQMP